MTDEDREVCFLKSKTKQTKNPFHLFNVIFTDLFITDKDPLGYCCSSVVLNMPLEPLARLWISWEDLVNKGEVLTLYTVVNISPEVV